MKSGERTHSGAEEASSGSKNTLKLIKEGI